MAAAPQRVRSSASENAISTTVLIVSEPFPGLGAERVAGALARGLEASERRFGERRLTARTASPPVSAEELRAARAVVIAAARLDERTLMRSWAFQIATDARQAGVPAYAVTAENALDRFDARMLDLQAIFEAHTTRALRAVGAKLARVV